MEFIYEKSKVFEDSLINISSAWDYFGGK